jgi:tRNA (uracil-5-)-methyltransferase
MTTDFSPSAYQAQLDEKIAILKQDFAEFNLPSISIFRSPEIHYRMRAEFRMWHKGDNISYVMFSQDEYKRPYELESFPVGSKLMNELMAKLLKTLNNQEILRHKLFQTDFLTTLSGQALITLIYHKPLGEEWQAAAQALEDELGVYIIGRSRGQKLILNQAHVIEQLDVNGRRYDYQQIESSFTQPNAKVCEQMLSWAVSHTQELGGDLLELYCGNGNFTLPLAQNFQKVLATEIAKPAVESALFNMQLNKVENIQIARMSSEDFSQAMDGVREFTRLKHVDLSSYNFSTIFVDPPRAGMDPHTTAITQRFENIIYISCNPETLRNNLRSITQTHQITAFAAFDQFPYTYHLECGVILQKKSR